MIKGSVILSQGKQASIERFHPWVFSGAIRDMKGDIKEGDIVEVLDTKKKFLGLGHYQKGGIAVRLFSFEDIVPDKNYWKQKLLGAIAHRKELGLFGTEHTNACRLVFGEGDGLPGLIMDYYDGAVVLQSHSLGMHMLREDFAEALLSIKELSVDTIYDKSAETLPAIPGTEIINKFLHGDKHETMVREYDNKFFVNWIEGQKTGFFIDQRENRKLLGSLSKGKRVLNTFCYSGGFSIYAMNQGAAWVDSVDSSAKAIELTEKNTEINHPGWNRGSAHTSDVFDFLDKSKGEYDIIILDPPAFAKHKNKTHNALMGYKRLNTEAIRQIKKGGYLFTFSCSGLIHRKLFHDTIMSAAIVAGRKAQVIYNLSQPPDHPVSIFHPEGEYLKGLVLKVD